MNTYNVIVGNVGQVHAGHNLRVALRAYREADADADLPHGLASGESVTLLCNGEPIAERVGGTCDLLSIDAWRTSGTWEWNAWYMRRRVPLAWCDLDARGLFAKLRAAGFLAPASFSADGVEREDDGYNIVVKARGTGEPLLALAYGAEAGA